MFTPRIIIHRFMAVKRIVVYPRVDVTQNANTPVNCIFVRNYVNEHYNIQIDTQMRERIFEFANLLSVSRFLNNALKEMRWINRLRRTNITIPYHFFLFFLFLFFSFPLFITIKRTNMVGGLVYILFRVCFSYVKFLSGTTVNRRNADVVSFFPTLVLLYPRRPL